MSLLEDRLTVIITTSPTPSSPSTELLSGVIDSFRQRCNRLLDCRVVVALDGYDQVVEKARLKKGQVEPAQADAYSAYKENVKSLISESFSTSSALATSHDLFSSKQFHAEAEFGGPNQPQNSVSYKVTQLQNGRISFIEPEKRVGFGLAVRSALRLVTTPYVWVHQHDWSLEANVPAESLVQIMAESSCEAPISYVCFPAVRMKSYATSAHVREFPTLRDITEKYKGDYSPATEPDKHVSLTPLFFWHDKPHVASTSHYLERVFPSRFAMSRGDFIEDTIGHRCRTQMKNGEWHKWATWLYYPDEGTTICLRHLQGRTWRGSTWVGDRSSKKKDGS